MNTYKCARYYAQYILYFSSSVKQRFYVNYDSCNIPLPPEPVCGIHVLNEGNRIEFYISLTSLILLAS